MSDIQINDIYDVAIQTDSRHPNLPSDIQIGGQIWMSDIFKFGCHAPKLFYDGWHVIIQLVYNWRRARHAA